MKSRRHDKEEEAEAAAAESGVRCKAEKLVLLSAPRSGGPTQTIATTTPVHPWNHQQPRLPARHFNAPQPHQPLSPIPARKLAAAVWEFIQYFSPPASMDFRTDRQNQPRRRDHYLHHRHHQGFLDVVAAPEHHQPPTASNLRGQVAMLLAQHNRSREHNHLPPQPPSPASYGSSIEINAYNNQGSTPSSSIELKGKMAESSFGFKTSTELLKVLNRIWTLEEQHVSNVTLVKDLKTELDRARAKILELLRDQHSSRNEMNELMKQLAEDKASKKCKEQERVHATMKSLKDELENERKLRKRSEGLHRRLAREMFEVKVALSTSLKEVERERSGRCLLEDLCDEFAKGILESEQDVHALRQKNGIGSDRLVVHMSESWLDERIQMQGHQDDQGMIVDKIRDEIEHFLQTRKMLASKQRHSRRKSLESFPLNEIEIAREEVENDPINDTKVGVNQGKDNTDKGKGTIDKPVSELLRSEGNRATGEQASKNSLKAKLQEPKTRAGYRSRLRILKGSS